MHSFSGEDSDSHSCRARTCSCSSPPTRRSIRPAWSPSTSRPSTADLRQLDDQQFSLAWDHEADVRLQIDLVSRDAHLASTPTEVAIGLKTDHPPRVTLGFTGVRQRVTPMARIPLTVDARDDYGVASAGLSLKIETPDPANPGSSSPPRATWRSLAPWPATDLEVQQAHTLELDSMKLPPGSLVTVNAVATDACYTGPQTNRSRLVAFRVVPPEELFREICCASKPSVPSSASKPTRRGPSAASSSRWPGAAPPKSPKSPAVIGRCSARSPPSARCCPTPSPK